MSSLGDYFNHSYIVLVMLLASRTKSMHELESPVPRVLVAPSNEGEHLCFLVPLHDAFKDLCMDPMAYFIIYIAQPVGKEERS